MDEKIIDDPNEVAYGFNNYFASIDTKLASKFAINDYVNIILWQLLILGLNLGLYPTIKKCGK